MAPLEQPSTIGSQLIYYYDAREGFTTFVNISQVGVGPLTIRLDVWDATFNSQITQVFTLAIRKQRVIDVGALKTTGGLGAQQGVAIASIMNDFGNPIDFPALTAKRREVPCDAVPEVIDASQDPSRDASPLSS